MALRYTTFKLTASANSAGTSSVHKLVAGLRAPVCQVVQSGSITGMSCTVRVLGTNCASGFTGSGYTDVRIGSLAIATATDQLSALLLSAFGDTGIRDLNTVFPFKYMKFNITTLSQGTPVLVVGGFVDDTWINGGQDGDQSTAT